ncbi:hypothetical protein ACA910_008969 [Epithemia clementina (nom. ined.)]
METTYGQILRNHDDSEDRDGDIQKSFWQDIPVGALDIVKQIAAFHLMERLIGSRPADDGHLASSSSPLPPSSTSSTLARPPVYSTRTIRRATENTFMATALSLSSPPSSTSSSTTKPMNTSCPYDRSIDVDAVMQLVKQCPAVCQETFLFVGKDGQSRYLHPLALICTFKPTLELVQTVNEAYPRAVSAQEPSRGSLPLHYAAAYEAPLEVLQYLVSKHPNGLKACLTENISPLDLACYHFSKERRSCGNIRFLLSAYPEAAGEKCNEHHWYPLHSAVSSGASLHSVILPLFKAYPKAISSLGKGAVSPLHIAAKQQNYARVTEFLVANSPMEILTTEDQEGHTPLTYAAMHQTARVIASLVGRLPEAHVQRGYRGWTLLHLAAVYNHNLQSDAVTYLAKRFPHQLTSLTWHCRSTPLHLACRKGAPLDNIKTLARLNRDVLQITDGCGKTPYDLALRRPENDDVVNFLRDYEANPMAPF